MKKLFPLLFYGILFVCPLAFAEDMSFENVKSFADYLFEKGDYYRAITEYERVIFLYPNSPVAKDARFQIADSYLKGEKFDQAITLFNALAREYPNEEIGIKASFMVGEAYYQKRDSLKAVEVFTKFIETYSRDTRADEARLKIGWSYLRQGKWLEAKESLQKLPLESSLHSKAEGLSKEVLLYPDIPRKSPTLAGGLSAVLPGAGQLYINKPGDAMISFLLNGTFIWATIESFRHHNKVTGGILLGLESGWYLGNIYNAVNGASKYNRRAEEQFMDSLQKRYDISFYYDGHRKSTISFVMRF